MAANVGYVDPESRVRRCSRRSLYVGVPPAAQLSCECGHLVVAAPLACGSVQTGVDQTKSRVNPTTETKNCAQFLRQMPEPRYKLHKSLIGARNSHNMPEKAFYLGNVGLEGEPNHAKHTDRLGRILDVDRRLRRGCRADV